MEPSRGRGAAGVTRPGLVGQNEPMNLLLVLLALLVVIGTVGAGALLGQRRFGTWERAQDVAEHVSADGLTPPARS